MKKTLSLICLGLTLTACNSNSIYSETAPEFENYTWTEKNVLKFNPTIEDNSKPFDIVAETSHLFGTASSSVEVKINIISPSGHSDVKTAELTLKGNDCAGDFCDGNSVLLPNYLFTEKGTYTFEVTPSENNSPITGLMKFGLQLKKCE